VSDPEHLKEIAVYDCPHRLGYIVERGAELWAANDEDQVLGRYPTEKAAVQAVVANARRGR
jgi:hypothetical protein